MVKHIVLYTFKENVDKEVFYINGYVPEATDLTN